MARRKVIYVDGTSRQIVESPFSRNTGTVGDFFTGEKVTLDVVPLKSITGGNNPSYEPDTSYASDTFKVGVGVTDYPPDSGDYKVTYNAGTSAAISYDENAAGVQSSLNAVAEIIAAGYVDVTGSLDTGYRIRWRTDGAKLDFGSAEVNLLPECDVSFTIEKEGASGIKEVVIMRLLAKKAALTTSVATIPPGEMTTGSKVTGSTKTREVTQLVCVADTAPVVQREEFRAVAVGGVRQRATITTIADAAGNLNGDYFELYDDEGSVGVWFDHGNAGTAMPAGAAALDRQIEITTVANGDSDGVIADKIATALTADSKFTATHVGNVATVTYSTIGAHGAAAAGTSGFTVANPTTGASTDAYAGDYFYHYYLTGTSGDELVRCYYFAQSEAVAPPAASFDIDSVLVRIIYEADATAEEMATTIAAAINTVGGVEATASGPEVHLTHDFAGVVDSLAPATAPFTNVAVTQTGADSTLDGKHFILYETNGVGGEQSRAFWFNVSGTAAPAGSALTADTTTEITTVASGALAHEVAEAVSSAVGALPTFSAYAKGTKVVATASVGYNFTTSTAETSGFTVTTATQGGAGSDASAVWEVAFSDVAIGGVYVLGFDTGNGVQYSGAIPFNAPPNTVTEIVEAMPMTTRGDVLVEGGSGGNLRLSFRNNLANTAVTVTVDDAAIVWVQGLRFTLDLNTTSAHGLLYGKTELEGVLEVEASRGSDYTVKLVNESCVVYNGLIDPSSTNPSPLLSYYTGAQVDNLVIHHAKTITSLAGGTSADLDSIATTSLTPPRAVFFWNSDEGHYDIYVLEAGTTAEALPNIVRPDDYNVSTNAKFWRLVRVDALTNPMTTLGDIILGGASGAVARLGIGASETFLKSNGTTAAWTAIVVPGPYPTDGGAAAAKTTGYTLVSADSGSIIKIDTSSGNVDAIITDAMTADYTANSYFYIIKVAAANTSQISISGATTINDSSASLTLTHNVPVKIWRAEQDSWYTI